MCKYFFILAFLLVGCSNGDNGGTVTGTQDVPPIVEPPTIEPPILLSTYNFEISGLGEGPDLMVDFGGQLKQNSMGEAAVITVLVQPAHHRQWHHLTVCSTLDGVVRAGRIDRRRQLTDSRGGEQHPWTQCEATPTSLESYRDRHDAV